MPWGLLPTIYFHYCLICQLFSQLIIWPIICQRVVKIDHSLPEPNVMPSNCKQNCLLLQTNMEKLKKYKFYKGIKQRKAAIPHIEEAGTRDYLVYLIEKIFK